ncbi:MAG: sigma 54-interacting transcriptional regulator [Syntrophales bacterium]|nr:sigma 54-interacting transcriptional regulator [Syntrophales bacterium]
MSRRNFEINQLSLTERDLLFSLAAFQDFFSLDWFLDVEGFRPSCIVSVVNFLKQKKWITSLDSSFGFYRWTCSFPRDEVLLLIPENEKMFYLRRAADLLKRHLPSERKYLPLLAESLIKAGLRDEDLPLLLEAAFYEEECHRTSQAVRIYDTLLTFLFCEVIPDERINSEDFFKIMLTALERRVMLSLLYPDIKKMGPWLLKAREVAGDVEDVRSLARLELLIGQFYWMSFQYEQSVQHFESAWGMIEKFDDMSLRKRGLQLRSLSFLIRGNLCKAIQAYEEYLGELEEYGKDDFSLITALHLCQCYTQIGMPQRALGIAESILDFAKKQNNWPIVCFSLATAGVVLLEMMHLKESRDYFEKALEISRKENIPMAEIIAGIGLANIECLEGYFERAAEHFKVLFKIRKSSWYHTLNVFHIFEPGFILHRHGKSPMPLESVIGYLSGLKEHQLNPILHSTIRRLKIKYLEPDYQAKDKIRELRGIESTLEKVGAHLELAKTRIDLARLYLEVKQWSEAEEVALKAWDFLRRVTKAAFPSDLKGLLSLDEGDDTRLYDIIIEMGEALTTQKNTEHLLTNIVASISRLTGAERAAIFIMDKRSSEYRIVASRNLTREYFDSREFKMVKASMSEVTIKKDSRVIQTENFGDKTNGRRKIILTPLLLGKQVIGILYQDSRYFSLDLTPDGLRLLSALGAQIAVSIDRAKAYDEIVELNEKLMAQNIYYQEEKEEFRPFGDIVYSSKAMRDLINMIHKVAPTKSTVLITGETGVGKELIARAIHRESARRNGPFIRVNCAALPETLIDSELFGHEKGAFTGATRLKPGRFELANQGTIFLDEVSELPLSTQSRLLRVLQEGEFQRVGGTKMLYSDFRLLAATNKDLEKEVHAGRFRSDLYFRLNVFPIRVPPLRERKEDIIPLAQHFLRRFSQQYNKPCPSIPRGEMEKLMNYSWPGNVRELANVIERAVILGDFDIRLPTISNHSKYFEIEGPFLTLKEMERKHIIEALQITGGRLGGKKGAAALLGVKRTTLIHRMKKLGINVNRNLIIE